MWNEMFVANWMRDSGGQGEGDGYKQIDMQFLPDVLVKCKVCGGTRYRREILAVTYRGKSIAEVLALPQFDEPVALQ